MFDLTLERRSEGKKGISEIERKFFCATKKKRRELFVNKPTIPMVL